MDEAMLKSGQYPNVAIMAGADPKEVMKEYANDDTRDALKERINRFNVPKSEENAENDASKGVSNTFDVRNDSREKLEADAVRLVLRMVDEAYDMGLHEATWRIVPQSVRECVGELLDRQAAITRAECAEGRRCR